MLSTTYLIARPIGLMALAFVLSFFVMPAFVRLLRTLKMGKTIRDAKGAPVMSAMHQKKAGTPTMGGVVIWGTVLALALIMAQACYVADIDSVWCQASFLSRGQTWLPLGLMVAAALVGMIDDYLNIRRLGPHGGGLRKVERVASYTLIAVIGAWWFYTKLGWSQLHVPFMGTFNIGWWYVPFFILTMTATSLSVNETDGLDGLAGGGLLASFGAFAVIAWAQGRTDLATLCAVIVGALLGFLWYNVNPASVMMGDTGAMSLGTVLGAVALMTNHPLLLPIIGLPFVVESLSVLLQVASKLLRKGKKIFHSAPIHHHLEAIGWTEPQIVMRFWLVSFVCAGVGSVLALIDRM